MSFKISVINPPVGSVVWFASFTDLETGEILISTSGWLPVYQAWTVSGTYTPIRIGVDCDFRITIADVYSNYTFADRVTEAITLQDNKSYIYNCATRSLYEGVVEEVTGEILTPKVEIDGVAQSWGGDAVVNDRYRVLAYAKYHAPEKKRTKMYLTVHAPDGREFACSDSELWPYTAPDTQITFSLPTPSDNPLGWKADLVGGWWAELRYVWIK